MKMTSMIILPAKNSEMKSLLVVVLSILGVVAQAQNPFEDEIRKFEAVDRKTPPGEDVILFTGSSSIRFWKTLKKDFPGYNVLNRGFGGSQFSDLLHFYDRVILPYQPSKILIYEGDNDIAAGKSPERVFGDFKILVSKISEDLPGCEIGFISIKPSPSRWDMHQEMEQANARIRSYCEANNLSYIDVYTPMLENDYPKASLFVKDSLHMTGAGYMVWVDQVKEFVKH